MSKLLLPISLYGCIDIFLKWNKGAERRQPQTTKIYVGRLVPSPRRGGSAKAFTAVTHI